MRAAHRRLLSPMLVLVLLMSTFGIWLQRPQLIGATSTCYQEQCFKKANWTGDRGSFSGGATTMRVPVDIFSLNNSSALYIALWVWDDYLGAFITVGMKFTNGDLHYFWGDQRQGAGYYEDVRGEVIPYGARGTNVTFEIWQNGNTVPVGQYAVDWYSDDYTQNGSYRSYPNYMQPMRTNEGLDMRGSDLHMETTPFTRNKYYLLAGDSYFHHGLPNYYNSNPNYPYQPSDYWQDYPNANNNGGDWRVYIP